ncbi:hypothetical protein LQ953_15310 [Sphingomonas sp. IC-56]|uniref:hypothetical protein n=1 Tax=Sphingomonas sp. IC-56 TaxID=2898529 RepID=UPI001E4C0C0B|nr:hypothetical protein [Sphingomonas sp. IC-56]MCD2325387.1 hypothetical protein [Sphingomonas sp. IC-56]
MENPRTETARDTDDSAMIENLETGVSQGSTSGGNLARDIATEDELAEVTEPDASTRVRKGHTLEHGTEVRPDRARNADS